MRSHYRSIVDTREIATQLVAALNKAYADRINDSAEFAFQELAGGAFEVGTYFRDTLDAHRVPSTLLAELKAFSNGFQIGARL